MRNFILGVFENNFLPFKAPFLNQLYFLFLMCLSRKIIAINNEKVVIVCNLQINNVRNLSLLLQKIYEIKQIFFLISSSLRLFREALHSPTLAHNNYVLVQNFQGKKILFYFLLMQDFKDNVFLFRHISTSKNIKIIQELSCYQCMTKHVLLVIQD